MLIKELGEGLVKELTSRGRNGEEGEILLES